MTKLIKLPVFWKFGDLPSSLALAAKTCGGYCFSLVFWGSGIWNIGTWWTLQRFSLHLTVKRCTDS
jgi:hypothetical protein